MTVTDFLLDTNMLGYLAQVKNGGEKPEAKNVQSRIDAVRAESRSKFFISTVTIGETEYGLRVAPQPDLKQQVIAREVLGSFPLVLDIDANAARDHYAVIRSRVFDRCAQKKPRGTAKKTCIEQWINPTTGKELGIDENDLWIVATAAAYNLTLVTNDKMQEIIEAADPPIRIENWTQPVA